MGSIPFAFSVHHFISSVGADAGFAAIIGLAVLVLLFFAQARETATLRDEAQESAQRVQQLEARLAQLARAQPAAPADAPSAAGQPGGPAPGRPAPAPPGIPATAAGRAQGAEAPDQSSAARPAARPIPSATPAGASAAAAAAGGAAAAGEGGPSDAGSGAGGSQSPQGGGASPPARAGDQSPSVAAAGGSPSAPAGVGAPALTAATRLIPPSEQEPSGGDIDAYPSPGAGEAGEPDSAREPAGLQSAEDTGFAAPATAAGSAAAAGTHREGANGAPPEPVAAPAAPSRAVQPPRGTVRTGVADAARPRPSSLRPLSGDSRPPSRARRVIPVMIGLIAIAAIIVGLLALTSGGTTSNRHSTANNAASNAPSTHHSPKRAGPKPSSVTVAVLNGTATSGLAHRVAVKLGSAGYKQGTVATATDQTRTATVVAFMPSHRRDALSVASALKLGPASVQPVDANTQAVACPPPAACPVSVVVTVGSDLSSTQ